MSRQETDPLDFELFFDTYRFMEVQQKATKAGNWSNILWLLNSFMSETLMPLENFAWNDEKVYVSRRCVSALHGT